MSKYKVLVLGLQGRNKKVYGPGDVVDDAHLPNGNGKELVKKGYLELVEDSKKPKTDQVGNSENKDTDPKKSKSNSKK